MSHHSNGEETGSPEGDASVARATAPAPVATKSSSRKKRRSTISPQEKVEKVTSVLAELKKAKEEGSQKGGTPKTRAEILKAHGMDASQLTRWQQVCYVCWDNFKSHKEAFSCSNIKCKKTFCKTCVGLEVVRVLSLSSVFRHTSCFKCMACQVTGAFDLKLQNDANATRKLGLCAALEVRVKVLLKEIDEIVVPLMSRLCVFRSKMKANYEEEDVVHQLFSPEEVETMKEFISLFNQYSGLKIGSNGVKSRLRRISFSIKWLTESFGIVLEEEFENWVLSKHQFEGWYAMMIEFTLKCHERMIGLEDETNIEEYPFWGGLRSIAISEISINVE